MTAAVLRPAATLMMRAPASTFWRVTSSKRVMDATTGMSTVETTWATMSGVAGELSTTPAAPCISETAASSAARRPVVVPPPTPTKSGASATVRSACVMAGCAVKG